VVRSLQHLRNEKSKSFVVGFFNGDLKVFDGKDEGVSELISVSGLH
jgi:hypothetical protein